MSVLVRIFVSVNIIMDSIFLSCDRPLGNMMEGYAFTDVSFPQCTRIARSSPRSGYSTCPSSHKFRGLLASYPRSLLIPPSMSPILSLPNQVGRGTPPRRP